MKKKQLMETEQNIESSVNKKNIVFIGVIGLIILLGVLYVLFTQFHQVKKLPVNKIDMAKTETKSLVESVGKLMMLPKNEEPTVATVSDKTKLLDQPFFINAENGDKVLIYTNAKKAILYRPSINKIIEVGPINIAAPTPGVASAAANMVTPTITTTVTPTPIMIKVAIYNGTKTTGLALTTEKQITGKYPNINVVLKSNAKSDYTKTMLIDLTGTNSTSIQQLITLLGGETGSLPSGETKPDADILVILGK